MTRGVLHRGNGGRVSGRYFLVGAARSGTTLLQAMIASHSRVFSFPESHFFCHALPRSRRYRLFGLAQRRKAARALDELLGLLERADLGRLVPRRSPFMGAYCRLFVQAIDEVALGAGKDVWLEKTPHHVDFVPQISRWVPGACFIHMLRDGRDVIASQWHAQMQDPAYWGEWSLERLTALWNRDVQTSLEHLGRPGHLHVSYEALLDEPESELRRVCAFMKIEFEHGMLEHWRVADEVIGFRRNDPWMQKAYEPLEDTRLKKYVSVFTDEQRQYIEARLLWGGRVGEAYGLSPSYAVREAG